MKRCRCVLHVSTAEMSGSEWIASFARSPRVARQPGTTPLTLPVIGRTAR